MLYLFIDEKRDTTLLKIGFTENLANREKSYNTDNPLIKKIAYIKLDKQIIEKEYHFELLSLGLKRVNNTEWFEINPAMAEFIEVYGFNAFENTDHYPWRVSYIYGTDCKNPYPKIKLRDFLNL